MKRNDIMEKAKEILERMKDKRTWKEAEVSMEEVKEVLNEFMEGKNGESNNDAESRRLRSKVERLTESNKQLIAENKRLKGGK